MTFQCLIRTQQTYAFTKLLYLIFEKLLLIRLTPILDDSGIIPDHQLDFRAEHSTLQQLYRVDEYIASGLVSKCYSNRLSRYYLTVYGIRDLIN